MTSLAVSAQSPTVTDRQTDRQTDGRTDTLKRLWSLWHSGAIQIRLLLLLCATLAMKWGVVRWRYNGWWRALDAGVQELRWEWSWTASTDTIWQRTDPDLFRAQAAQSSSSSSPATQVRHVALLQAEFHYASYFGAGSKLKFGLSSSLLAAN